MTPETWGVAMEVPLIEAYLPLFHVLRMLTPRKESLELVPTCPLLQERMRKSLTWGCNINSIVSGREGSDISVGVDRSDTDHNFV